MKKILFLFSFISSFACAQNFIQNSISFPTCFGMCDGTVVLSTTTTTGPFTAVLTNTSGCTNSTVQSSTGNTITIGGLCACASDYSVNIYNSSMVLVGFELLQIPITATSALVMQTPTVDPATCAACCNGSVYVSFSGGYTPSSNHTVTLDGAGQVSYTPISTVCVGPHTVCVKDQANCIVCNSFTLGHITDVNTSALSERDFKLFPNPAQNALTILFDGNMPHDLKFFDLTGKMALRREFENTTQQKFELDISGLKAGVYVLEATGPAGIFRQKLIKLE